MIGDRQIHPDVLAWHAGITDWVRGKEVSGFRPLPRKITIWDILHIVLMAMIIEWPIHLIANGFTASPFWGAALGVATFDASVIAVYQWLCRYRGWESLRVRFSPIKGRVVFAIAGGAIVWALLGIAVLPILARLGFGLAESPQPAWFPTTVAQLLPSIIGIAVMVPVAEELMFRGLLLDWLRQKMGRWLAVMIVSLIFAILHDNNLKSGIVGWLGFSDKFMSGIVMGILRIRLNSLRAPLVFHATINFFALIFGFLFPSF